MQLRVKRPKKRITESDRKKRNSDTMRWIEKKYRMGDLDLSKKSHRITARIAVNKGILPKEVFDE